MKIPIQISLLQTKMKSKVHRLFCVFDSECAGWQPDLGLDGASADEHAFLWKMAI